MIKLFNELNFNHPPPPELRYKYPEATQDIVHNISRTLLNCKPFYTQVLHLMNRMNLPPPFYPPIIISASHQASTTTAVSCQTDNRWLKRLQDLATDESEMESDEEESFKVRKRKSKTVHDIHDPPKRFKTIIEREKDYRMNNIHKLNGKQSVWTNPKSSVHKPEIKLKIPETLNRKRSLKTNSNPVDQTEPVNEYKIEVSSPSPLTRAAILSNQITVDKLRETNPIFLSYDPGTPSNVLYIKNIAKSVTVQDLQQIYHHFVDDPSTITIDLKTTGRLRGQAFIKFNNKPPNQSLVTTALEFTNGYMLKEKPIYVCYSKSSNK